MKKWIRWQGLIAFAVLTTVIAVLWVFFLDGFVKRMIEKVGTSLVGAEVDVNSADVKLFPLGITLRGLQVTDPEAPSTNSIECSRIAFSLDGLNLLRRKMIVNEMAVEGMRFATPRKRPGTVKKREEKAAEPEKKSSFSLAFEMPDPKKILKSELLESPKLIESAKAEMQRMRDTWQKQPAGLPDQKKIDEYKARIEKLKKSSKSTVGDIVGQMGEVKALTTDIERDLKQVKQVRNDFSKDLTTAKSLIEKAERGPLDDVKRLKERYGISAGGMQNMSQALFGDRIGSWVRSGVLWYNRLKPVFARTMEKKKDVTVVKPIRGRGMNVRFKEARPLPDLLIEKTAVSAEVTAGTVAGTIKNITPDQDVLGKPLTFSFSGEALKGVQALALTGALNHITPTKPEDTARLSMSGYQIKDLALSTQKDLLITLQDGKMDLVVQGVLGAKTMSVKFTATIQSARMSTVAEGSSKPLVAAIQSTLSGVSHFTVSGDIEGTPEDYRLTISSDLDRVLKDAAGNLVREQSARFEQELLSGVRERTEKQMKELKDGFGGLNGMGSKIDDAQNTLNSLLKDTAQAGGAGKLKLWR
jgi:uncharacterized protein (TIGR03545 family)